MARNDQFGTVAPTVAVQAEATSITAIDANEWLTSGKWWTATGLDE
jgi:hypothetical protein